MLLLQIPGNKNRNPRKEVPLLISEKVICLRYSTSEGIYWSLVSIHEILLQLFKFHTLLLVKTEVPEKEVPWEGSTLISESMYKSRCYIEGGMLVGLLKFCWCFQHCYQMKTEAQKRRTFCWSLRVYIMVLISEGYHWSLVNIQGILLLLFQFHALL